MLFFFLMRIETQRRYNSKGEIKLAKELKNVEIKARITKSQKELLDEYCEVNETNVSDFIRDCLNERLK